MDSEIFRIDPFAVKGEFEGKLPTFWTKFKYSFFLKICNFSETLSASFQNKVLHEYSKGINAISKDMIIVKNPFYPFYLFIFFF